jgi:hypothetical protein
VRHRGSESASKNSSCHVLVFLSVFHPPEVFYISAPWLKKFHLGPQWQTVPHLVQIRLSTRHLSTPRGVAPARKARAETRVWHGLDS